MSVIKSDEKLEYASSVFLKWFTDSERNIEFSINSGYLPVKKEANNFEKVSEINSDSEKSVNDATMNAIKIAIDEINSCTLYTSMPFEKSAETRDILSDSIQNVAIEDYKEISKRIKNGEKRDKVLEEYTNDEYFENWFENFSETLKQTMNEK